MDRPPGDVTRLIEAAHAGDPRALEELLPHVYDELRAVAHGLMAREGGGATLDATGLVHELWLRLERQESVGFEQRSQFFGATARTMRRILVDHARRRARKTTESDLEDGPIDPIVDALEQRSGSLTALGAALDRLAVHDARKAHLVELRFFAGLPMTETAEVLGVSLRQAERDWTMAKAWLRSQLDGGGVTPN